MDYWTRFSQPSSDGLLDQIQSTVHTELYLHTLSIAASAISAYPVKYFLQPNERLLDVIRLLIRMLKKTEFCVTNFVSKNVENYG